LKITTRCLSAATVVEIDGSIDVYSASAVGQAIQSLIADGVKQILLDLSLVGSLDSSGLGTLVGNAKAISSIGGSISLVGANDRIRRMLAITNLDRYFRTSDSEIHLMSGASCEEGR
jgi:anti-sigma B factor antagonist